VQRIPFWNNFHSPPAKHRKLVRGLVNEMADVSTFLVLPTVTVGAMIVSLCMNSIRTFLPRSTAQIEGDAIALFASGLGVT
jgi:hypothetical protein